MAVFTPRPLQIPNLTTNYSAENSAFANLGQTLGNLPGDLRKEQLQAQKQQLLGQLATGNLDYEKAGRSLLALGDTTAGATLLSLGQKQQQLDAQKGIGNLLSSAPGSAAPAAAPATSSPSDPRGVRNLNPGNIEDGNFAKSQPGYAGSDGRFAKFDTMENGVNAQGKLLETYNRKYGINTISGVVNRWAPSAENGAATGNYTNFVARKLGVGPNDAIDLTSPETQRRVALAMAEFENGRPVQLGGLPKVATAQPEQARPTNAPAQESGGTYAGVPAETLQGYIDNPRVPDNLKAMMRQELAGRQTGGASVQVAQAPAQPGAPVADIPASGAAPVTGPGTTQAAQAQGFAIPGTSLPPNDPAPGLNSQQLMGIIANPNANDGQRALAKSILDNRQKYTDENAPDKREQTRLATEQARLNVEKLKREVEGEGGRPMTDAERKAYNVRDGQPAWIKRNGDPAFGPAGTNITNSIDKGETEEAKKIGESAGKRAGETMAAAASASKQLMRLGQIEALMKNVETGRLQPNRMSIAALGKAFGVDDKNLEAIGLDPKRLGDAQALNAISGRMLVDMIGSGGFPANNFSNTDREFLTGTLPSLANDPRANSLLITAARRMAELDIEKAKTWRTWKRDNPKGSFDDFEIEFADRIGGADRFADLAAQAQRLTGAPGPVARPDGSAQPQPGQPRPIATPQDYQAIRPGEQYVDPQGNIRTKR